MPLPPCNILEESNYRKKSAIIWKLNPGEMEKDLDRVRQQEKGYLLPKKVVVPIRWVYQYKQCHLEENARSVIHAKHQLHVVHHAWL